VRGVFLLTEWELGKLDFSINDSYYSFNENDKGHSMLTIRTETSTYLIDQENSRFMKIGVDNPHTVAPAYKWVACQAIDTPKLGSPMHMAFIHEGKTKIRETTSVVEIIDFKAELEADV
jgi:hypothetical protein